MRAGCAPCALHGQKEVQKLKNTALSDTAPSPRERRQKRHVEALIITENTNQTCACPYISVCTERPREAKTDTRDGMHPNKQYRGADTSSHTRSHESKGYYFIYVWYVLAKQSFKTMTVHWAGALDQGDPQKSGNSIDTQRQQSAE